MRTALLPLGLLLTLTGAAHATLLPIPITPASYNADVVVEKTATPVLKVVTTATVDQGTNNYANTWMEAGFDLANPGNGLPAPGTVIVAISNANYSFRMPPSYTAPNGILIDTVVTNGSLTFTAPATYTLLSFLGSGGNGGDVIGVTIRHQDGTMQTGNTFPCPDWFNGTSNVTFIANERVGSSLNLNYANINSGNPRLYFRDVPVTNTTSAITNVELKYVSGGANSHNDVLAVSGATTLGGAVSPIDVTGFTYDFIVEKEAAKRARTVTSTVIDGTNVWATSQSMDNTGNTGNAWYEKGFNLNNPGNGANTAPIPDVSVSATTGLPAAGSLLTNAIGDHVYLLPPDYAANNAVWVAIPPAITNATITLATPTAASVLSLLASAGNGPVNNLMVVATHADATTETNYVNVANWFNATPYVYAANGRIAVETAQFNDIRAAGALSLNPRLYPVDFILANTVSPVTSLEIINTNTTGGRVAIFALSGTLGPVLPSLVSNPGNVTLNPGGTAIFTASAVANVPITYQWQKGTNGLFVNLTDGGNISGSLTTTLTVGTVSDGDEADYRLVATDSAGSANSGIGILTVLSLLPKVTVPTDSITRINGNVPSAAESEVHAIDDNTQKYLNYDALDNGAPFVGPVGFVVRPAMGRTRVTAMRLYTANDATERDPANVVLEGSDNGGASYTLIISNNITMPDGRNAGGLALDPLTQNIRQLKFVNLNGYTSYRWRVFNVRNNAAANSMQIGELELLGVADTSGKANFTTQPASVAAYSGTSVSFNVVVTGTPTPGLRWLKGTNGVYGALADGGNISGVLTDFLTINPAGLSDAADYVCVATNTSGSVTSLVARLTIVSTLNDVTVPTDPITSYGDTTSPLLYTGNLPPDAIDNSSFYYFRNAGSGLNNNAGFPPFEGPAGFVVVPAAGSTLLTGLRIYTSSDVVERDPTDYLLEGSNNGGTTYQTLSSGALTLPAARGDLNYVFDPIQQPMQEILFANSTACTSYRLTVSHIKGSVDMNAANSVSLGEVELLGNAVPVLTVTTGAGGSLTITTSLPGTLWSSTELKTSGTVWFNEGPITDTVTITPVPAQPQRFYRVSVP